LTCYRVVGTEQFPGLFFDDGFHLFYEQTDHSMIVVYVRYFVALGFCPSFKGGRKVFFAIQNDFQRAVDFDVGKSFGRFLKGIEK
jgi:hypothetical protein